jgi:hypothetical protein
MVNSHSIMSYVPNLDKIIGIGWIPERYFPGIRWAQRAALTLKYTGFGTAIDVGELKNIHPTHKQGTVPP